MLTPDDFLVREPNRRGLLLLYSIVGTSSSRHDFVIKAGTMVGKITKRSGSSEGREQKWRREKLED